MKIYGMDIPLNGYRQTAFPSRDTSTAFDHVFNRELAALQKTSEMSLDSGKTDDKARMLSQGDGILTLLETYAADLENPGKTLKQMAPLVEAIDHEVTRLEEKANARFSRDEALMDWVNELSLTARVATVKFHRGDFL
ncbi:MAG: hypothetical protein H0S81_04315 [Desulfotignum balticum]|jgi:glycyl-tRNA synthetase beta subunit|uniref:Uncharacterized protein n=1 Tax=Desulfotignum balticum TaxID=115781 RepID=A0A931G768_9BACT|nr:hypothetical protein [Desulfotignum balticum]